MTSAVEPSAPQAILSVLAAAADAGVLRTIERACTAEQYAFHFATDVAEALATGASEQPDVAFVDVMLEGGAGLALVHHLPAVCGKMAVYVIVPPPRVELGTQAMALGASGILLDPPSGDGLLRALSDVRERRAIAQERARLLAELESWKHRTERLERIARLAGKGDRVETAAAVAEALAEASRASGAAIYLVDGEGGRTRLAAVGSAAMLDAKGGSGQSLEGAQLLPLSVGDRKIGYAFLDTPSHLSDDAIAPIVHVAAALLASTSAVAGPLLAPRRETFRDSATREIERARRHGRRVAIGAMLASDTARGDGAGAPRASGASGASSELVGVAIERLVSAVVRESDVLGRGERGEYYLLLPETGALGAHACRRRIQRLASWQLAVGVATYPHDGATVESLVSRAYRRAIQAQRSIVFEHGLQARSLGDVLGVLLDAPLSSEAAIARGFACARMSLASARALVAAACREAIRGGATTGLLAVGAAPGVRGALQALSPDPAVTLHEVDSTRLDVEASIEAVVLVAEHGTWTWCARIDGDWAFTASSSDPILADVVAEHIARAGGIKLA